MLVGEPFVNYIVPGLYNSNRNSNKPPTPPVQLKYFPLQTPNNNNPIDIEGSGITNQTNWDDKKSWDDTKYWFDTWYTKED